MSAFRIRAFRASTYYAVVLLMFRVFVLVQQYFSQETGVDSGSNSSRHQPNLEIRIPFLVFHGFISKPDLGAWWEGTRDLVFENRNVQCFLTTYSKLGVQLVRVVDEVAELLSCQRPAGGQQILSGRSLSGRNHGNVQGLHRAESRHVQHQRDIRAPSDRDGWEGEDVDEGERGREGK